MRKEPGSGADPETPSLDVISKERMVYENVPSTGYVGMPLDELRYPDGKGGSATRYTIGGPDVASFVFAEMYDDDMTQGYYDSMLVDGPATDKFGQLAAAVVTHFDYEADKNEYIIEVTDPDAEVSVGPVRVTITVMNVNEAPSAPEELRGGLTITVPASSYAENGMDALGTFRAQGQDAAQATFSLSGTDAEDFALDSNSGELTFAATPDFEDPADANTDNMYEITVTATAGTNTVPRNVTVTVVNVNEDGAVTFDSTTASVGTALTASLTDPDGNAGDTYPIAEDTAITGATWQWASSAAADGTFTDIIGETSAAYTPADGDADMFLRATASYTDNQGADEAMKVTANAVGATPSTGSVLGDRYDSVANGGNGDGQLDTLEMLKAVREYFAEGSTITVQQMLELVRIYFGS